MCYSTRIQTFSPTKHPRLVQMHKSESVKHCSTFRLYLVIIVPPWVNQAQKIHLASQIIDKLCNQLFCLTTFNTSCMRSKIQCAVKSYRILKGTKQTRPQHSMYYLPFTLFSWSIYLGGSKQINFDKIVMFPSHWMDLTCFQLIS